MTFNFSASFTLDQADQKPENDISTTNKDASAINNFNDIIDKLVGYNQLPIFLGSLSWQTDQMDQK